MHIYFNLVLKTFFVLLGSNPQGHGYIFPCMSDTHTHTNTYSLFIYMYIYIHFSSIHTLSILLVMIDTLAWFEIISVLTLC